MKCTKVKKQLLSYLDGTIDKTRYNEIDQHLSACADCRQELTAFKKSWDLLEEYGTISVPANFTEKLYKRIQEEPLRPIFNIERFFPKWLPYVASAAVLIIVITIALVQPPLTEKQILGQTLPTEDIALIENITNLEETETIEAIDILDNLEQAEESSFIDDIIETNGDDYDPTEDI